jgi:epoxyqueuosine reductase
MVTNFDMVLTMEVESIISKRLTPSSEFIYGFANLSGLLPEEYKSYPLGISIGKRLDSKIVDSIAKGPNPDYFNHYKQVNSELEKVSNAISDDLSKLELQSIAIVPTFSLCSDEFKPYFKDLTYKISHKMVATRAGLGWIGKTDLFISKQFGPRLRLVSILVESAPINKVEPIEESLCGNCKICVKMCPAQAASGKLWNVSTKRDEFFNAHKCYAKCHEFGMQIFKKDIGICGICVALCPVGQEKNTNDSLKAIFTLH